MSEETVRQYYTYLDQHKYEKLKKILTPEFQQKRPDRTFPDRQAFLSFMRDERPEKETRHEIKQVFKGGNRYRGVRGFVRKPSGERWFEFLDVFFLDEEDRIQKLVTLSPSDSAR